MKLAANIAELAGACPVALLKDIERTGPLNIEINCTLNLGGYKISSSSGVCIRIREGANVIAGQRLVVQLARKEFAVFVKIGVPGIAAVTQQLVEGEAVTLLSEVDLGSNYIEIRGSSTFTLDLNGQTVKAADYGAFNISGGSLTIQDSGTGGKIESSYITIEVKSGTLSIKSGTVSGFYGVGISGGTVNISGGLAGMVALLHRHCASQQGFCIKRYFLPSIAAIHPFFCLCNR